MKVEGGGGGGGGVYWIHLVHLSVRPSADGMVSEAYVKFALEFFHIHRPAKRYVFYHFVEIRPSHNRALFYDSTEAREGI